MPNNHKIPRVLAETTDRLKEKGHFLLSNQDNTGCNTIEINKASANGISKADRTESRYIIKKAKNTDRIFFMVATFFSIYNALKMKDNVFNSNNNTTTHQAMLSQSVKDITL